jgi:hypothetical protein
MDKLGVKHQLCIFHLFKTIKNSVYKILKPKKITTQEKNKFMPLFHRIKKTYSTHTPKKTAPQRLKALLEKFNDIPKVLQRYITKKKRIIPDFQRLTHFMRSPFI